ncbi:hypothetical protein ACFL43_03790 [Thermodesulfobacteriota bacterium]
MEDKTTPTESGQQYAAAYNAHYTTKDMHKAFVLYGHIIAEHPAAREAEYSRSQVQNIVNAVVPKQKISEALEKLTLTHFKLDVPPDVN